MAEADAAPAKSRPRSRKKPTESSASLPPEIDSVGRTRAATRILVNLPKSTASAPAGTNESVRSAEIPELGDTRAATADGGPLPIPFSHNEWSPRHLKRSISVLRNSPVEPTCLPTPLDEPLRSEPISATGECTTS
ncbi:hypothetical protein B0H14DRAFT_2625997 [Mycena olivaceomarginata]|nr:hypothetical protein B0H14DRAFT_2625997 [Mycena olivaceomarginata]